LGTDIRRVSVQVKTFEEIQQIIQQLFKKSIYVVKYQDEDKDLITITCDLELSEALNFASKSNPPVLKLILEDKKSTNVEVPHVQAQLTGVTDIVQKYIQEIEKITPLFKQTADLALTTGPIADLTKIVLTGLRAIQQQAQETANSFLGNNNSANDIAPSSVAVHSGIKCDACLMNPILGVRYKCANCKDFDLCANCEAKGVHKDHVFIKLQRPIFQSWHNAILPNVYAGPGSSIVTHPHKRIGTVNTGSILVRHLARFVSDVSFPDGSEVPVNSKFTKIWKMRNEGKSEWPAGTKLIWVGGDKIGHVGDVPVPSVAPNGEVNISIDLVAPAAAGKYVGYWRLSIASGRFGHRIWTEIVVTDK